MDLDLDHALFVCSIIHFISHFDHWQKREWSEKNHTTVTISFYSSNEIKSSHSEVISFDSGNEIKPSSHSEVISLDSGNEIKSSSHSEVISLNSKKLYFLRFKVIVLS